MSSTFTDKKISWCLIASSLLTAEGLIGGAHLWQSSIKQMRECGASGEVTTSGGFGSTECPYGILKSFWWGGVRSDGQWQLLLHLRGRVNKPFFWALVCLWMLSLFNVVEIPPQIFLFFALEKQRNTCTHLSAEPKKKKKKKNASTFTWQRGPKD